MVKGGAAPRAGPRLQAGRGVGGGCRGNKAILALTSRKHREEAARRGGGPFGRLEILCMLWLHSHGGRGGKYQL